jgi:glucosylceramidase
MALLACLAAASAASPAAGARVLGRSPGDVLGRSPGDVLGRSPGDGLGRSPGDGLGRSPEDAPERSQAKTGSPVGPVVHVVLTTRDLTRALGPMPNLAFVARLPPPDAIDVYDGARRQRIIGFGGAMTDSSAWLLERELGTVQRARVMQALFSARGGIGLRVIRVPIGASDFTASGIPYTYDDLPPGQSDPTLSDFSIAHDRAYVIPALAQMLHVDPAIKILSTEWTAPPWMKANDSFDNVGGAGQLLAADYPLLAQYFVDFIEAYRRSGIPIWAVTPQNEPTAHTAYPGMELSAADEAQFISADLAPALRAAGLDTLIFGVDGARPGYAQALEATPAAGELAGIAWHCYGGEQTAGAFHLAFPEVLEITSECSPGIIPYGVSEAVLSGLNNGSSAFLLWNLVLDERGGPVQPPDSGCHGCRGIVTVNERTHRARLDLAYYQLGQFSRYILPGARIVGATRDVIEFARRYGVTPGLDDVAAIDPGGTRVLVVYNNSGRARSFTVGWKRRSFPYRLPARGTVTFTWRP